MLCRTVLTTEPRNPPWSKRNFIYRLLQEVCPICLDPSKYWAISILALAALCKHNAVTMHTKCASTNGYGTATWMIFRAVPFEEPNPPNPEPQGGYLSARFEDDDESGCGVCGVACFDP